MRDGKNRLQCKLRRKMKRKSRNQFNHAVKIAVFNSGHNTVTIVSKNKCNIGRAKPIIDISGWERQQMI